MYPWFAAINLINQHMENIKNSSFNKISLSEEQQKSGYETLLNMGLKKNDWLILLSGGHSFEILDDAQMIEVKNGPYAGDQDKIRF